MAYFWRILPKFSIYSISRVILSYFNYVCAKMVEYLLERTRYSFTARRYAGAVYAVVVCPSVCLSVTNRHCAKRLNLGSRKQRLAIAQGL